MRTLRPPELTNQTGNNIMENETQENQVSGQFSADTADNVSNESSEIKYDSDANTENHTSPLNVKLEQFEGPLDLLLHLIRENKIDIFDIPIAFITEKYLKYLSEMKQLDLDVSGEFLVMAATLIYIKSKMLLPVEEEDDEDEFAGIDPRDELVQKLLEYQSYKHAAKELGYKEDERSKMYTRSVQETFLDNVTAEQVETEFTDNLYELIEAFSRVIREKSKTIIHEVYEENISVEEKIFSIRDRLTVKGQLRFKELFSEKLTYNELIAVFIAVLELGKQRFAKIEQDSMFGEIVINKAKNDE